MALVLVGVLATAVCGIAAAQPAAAATPARGAVASRTFLPGDDSMSLWQQTVSRVVAGTPVTRLRSPLSDVSPPVDGVIETDWVTVAGGGPAARRERAVFHFVPIQGGAVLETAIETAPGSVAPPLLLPSVADASPILRPVAAEITTAAAWEPGQPLPDGTVRQLPPADSSRFAPAQPGFAEVPTMAPAYPNTWAPFAMPQYPAVARGLRKAGRDYANFYSCESLVCLTAAFGAGALMANTGFDTTMQGAWQTGVTPTPLGTFFSGCKPIGEGMYALPVFGAAAVTGLIFEGNAAGDVVGEWGSRTLRMFVVGAPPLYAMQWVTGASRPDQEVGSQWHFLADNNGVSGHAFVGAIPFLAAADMVESPLLKGTLYVCSTFTGFSRMTDNAHFPSQVFLGWYLAWASSRAVGATELQFGGVTMRAVPLPMANLGGMAVEARW